MMRHRSHRFETDADTFMCPYLSFHDQAWGSLLSFACEPGVLFDRNARLARMPVTHQHCGWLIFVHSTAPMRHPGINEVVVKAIGRTRG